MDEAGRVESNDRDSRKGFYTVSEAAKVLGVGQRRILEMLQMKEIEGERDPVSSRWKISKHLIDELAPEESPIMEKDAAGLRVTEEAQVTEERLHPEKSQLTNRPLREESTERSSEQSTEEIRERISELERINGRPRLERRAEKDTWQEEKESLLATADQERRRAEGLQEEIERLGAELGSLRERIGELESLNEHLQREQQAEKASWKKEKGALLAAANRELQHIEELQKEVARLRVELEETWGLVGKLEKVNEQLKLERQAEKAAWQEEKRSLLAAAHQDREHAEELQEEVKRLSTELEAERSKGFWKRLSGG